MCLLHDLDLLYDEMLADPATNAAKRRGAAMLLIAYSINGITDDGIDGILAFWHDNVRARLALIEDQAPAPGPHADSRPQVVSEGMTEHALHPQRRRLVRVGLLQVASWRLGRKRREIRETLDVSGRQAAGSGL